MLAAEWQEVVSLRVPCQAEKALILDAHLREMLLNRSMDVSPAVRRNLFCLLGMLCPFTAQRLCCLVRQGLADTDVMVRRECDFMLRSWAGSRDAGKEPCPVLKVINALLVVPANYGEPPIDNILHRLLACEEVEPVATQAVQLLLHGERPLERAEIMLARVTMSRDPDGWNLSGALKGSLLLRKTLDALDSGNISTLRQLLMVLLEMKRCDDVVAKTLLQIATATLLRCPLNGALTMQNHAMIFAEDHAQIMAADPFHLAVQLARHSLRLHCMGGRARMRKGQAELQFSESMQTVLRVLAEKAKASFPASQHADEGGLSDLARHGAVHRAHVLDLEQRIQDLVARSEQLTQARNFVAARPLREEVENLRQQRDEAQRSADNAFAALGRHLSRLLCVAEAILCHSQAELQDDFPLCLVMDDFLYPALLLVDSVPPGMSASTSWSALRARAIRCIALHATLSTETAVQHQSFFHSVLQRYVPEVLSAVHDHDAAAAAEDIVLTSLSFLIDTLLLHGTSSGKIDEQGSRVQDCQFPARCRPDICRYAGS